MDLSRKMIYFILILTLLLSFGYFPVVVGGDETCIHEGCNEPIWEESDEYCIFHDPDPNKDKVLFEQKLKEKIERGDTDSYDFSGFVFPAPIDFSKYTSTFIDADFSNAVFEEEVNFKGATFKGEETKFRNTVFKRNAHFEDAIFEGKATFISATFEQAVFFQRENDKEKITFQDGVTFSYTRFGGYTNFGDVRFKNYANFEHSIFQVGAFFERAKFLDSRISFDDAEFYGEVYFANAEFNEIDGYTTFRDAKFKGVTYFLETTFFENVYFDDTTFGKISHFNFAKFKGDKTWFNNAIFENNVFFKNVTFEKDTIFYGAEFNKIADFSDTSFEGEMNLDNVVFRDNVYFKNTDFGEIEEIKLSATFERMLIFKPKILYKLDLGEFKALEYTEIKANLTETEFKDVYLSNVNFIDCTWPEDYKVYEETHMNDDLSYRDLEKIYRNIKISFQNYGDNEMAGYFLYREKEMKREGTLFFKDPFYWALIHLYWGTCGYGERFSFILFWSFGTMVGFALLFWILGIEINTRPYRLENNFYRLFSWEIDNRNRVCGCWIFSPICSFFSSVKRHTVGIRRIFGNFAFCLLFSITSFSTLGTKYIKPKDNASRWLSAIESLIGAFFIALFIYVFARKMLR
ncbi:MAG: pentapeptide repeat-containing protein [Methanomicrobia archaeon]|nr:pentapeptide repeat-containing protein [Methanomicrobia archaeon]